MVYDGNCKDERPGRVTMGIKYSSTEGVVAWSGGTQLLQRGQSIDENHPLYQERPDLFQGLAPLGADIDTNKPAGAVESTQQAPGANRTARVPGGQVR